MILLIVTEKAFDEIQYSFMIKALKKRETGESYLNIIKTIHAKPIANVMLNWKN
jgi:hypothetical protein